MKNFVNQFTVVIFIFIFIIFVILLLYFNSTKNIHSLTNDLFIKQTKEKKIPQPNILPLFNDFEEEIITEEILNNNLVETYILYIYFDSTYGNELWLSNYHLPKNIIRREHGLSIQFNPSKNQLIINIPIKKLLTY